MLFARSFMPCHVPDYAAAAIAALLMHLLFIFSPPAAA